MENELLAIYSQLKKRGLTEDQEERILAEISFDGTHGVSEEGKGSASGKR